MGKIGLGFYSSVYKLTITPIYTLDIINSRHEASAAQMLGSRVLVLNFKVNPSHKEASRRTRKSLPVQSSTLAPAWITLTALKNKRAVFSFQGKPRVPSS